MLVPAVLATLVAAGAPMGARKPAWTPVGLAGGGSMYSIAGSPHDPKLMMLSCDMSGAYISRDGGRHWRMIHHGQLRGCTYCPPLFHPVKKNVIYAVSGWGSRLKVSTNQGRTWQDFVADPPWRGRLRGMYIDPGNPRRFFAGTEAGLWLSPDGGRRWQRCRGVTGAYLGICAIRGRRSAYAVGTDQGVFRSDNGGKTFQPSSAGLPKRKLTAFAGGSNRQVTMLYAAVECKVERGRLTGGVYLSKDGGASWQRALHKDLNTQTKRSSRWAHGDIPQYRFLLTTDKLPRRVYVYCPGTSYFPPNHHTIYRSDNAGKSWKAVFYSDPRFKRQYNVEDDRLTLSIGQRYQSAPYSLTVNPAYPDTLMMTTDMLVFYTHDGGRRWQVSQGRGPVKFGKNLAWPGNGLVVTTTWNYYIDPFAPKRHYICYTDIGFARSLDAGKTWIWEGYRLPWRNTVYELAFDPAIKGKIWGAFSNTHDIPNYNVIGGRHRVIMQGGVALSTDYGQTWKKSGLPEAPCVSVVLDPKSPKNRRTLYAAVFEKGVYKSTDDGRSWTRKGRGLGARQNLRCCKLVLHKDGTLFNLITAKRLGKDNFEGEGVGLYRSTDGAETWQKINQSQPLRWPKDFAVHPGDSRIILVGAGSIRGWPQAGLYRTINGGKTWKRIARKGNEHFGAAFHPKRKNWLYMTLTEGAPEAGLYLSRNNGRTWEPFTQLPFSNIHRVHFDPKDDRHIILTTFGGSVFKGPAVPR